MTDRPPVGREALAAALEDDWHHRTKRKSDIVDAAARERLAQLECEHCDDCGRAYCDVYDMPDALWARIHERAPAGLLCPTCALRRLGALHLAQLPEKCECQSQHPDVEASHRFMKTACHGKGFLYPSALVERIAQAIHDFESPPPHAECPSDLFKERHRAKAVAVLDALNTETP